VDAADYVVWRRGLGEDVTEYTGADGDGDGMVDDEDYNVWRTNFGMTADDADLDIGGAVPEPASATLVVFALAFMSCGRGRPQGQSLDKSTTAVLRPALEPTEVVRIHRR
jgi:hypothetical protein